MADEINAASRTERARKNEGAHSALSFIPASAAGQSATYDPYSSTAL